METYSTIPKETIEQDWEFYYFFCYIKEYHVDFMQYAFFYKYYYDSFLGMEKEFFDELKRRYSIVKHCYEHPECVGEMVQFLEISHEKNQQWGWKCRHQLEVEYGDHLYRAHIVFNLRRCLDFYRAYRSLSAKDALRFKAMILKQELDKDMKVMRTSFHTEGIVFAYNLIIHNYHTLLNEAFPAGFTCLSHYNDYYKNAPFHTMVLSKMVEQPINMHTIMLNSGTSMVTVFTCKPSQYTIEKLLENQCKEIYYLFDGWGNETNIEATEILEHLKNARSNFIDKAYGLGKNTYRINEDLQPLFFSLRNIQRELFRLYFETFK